MEGTNIVPVMDMNRNNNYGDCWGGGMWFMWIIVLFALMGGWGGNWNNRGNMGAEIFANGSMTRDQIADQFSMQDIKDGIRGVQNGLCDGFYAQNSTMLNGFNGVQRDIMQTWLSARQRDCTKSFRRSAMLLRAKTSYCFSWLRN